MELVGDRGRHDTRHNDTQRNDIEHNDTQHNTEVIATLSTECFYAEC
jgi:hypothetical protein